MPDMPSSKKEVISKILLYVLLPLSAFFLIILPGLVSNRYSQSLEVVYGIGAILLGTTIINLLFVVIEHFSEKRFSFVKIAFWTYEAILIVTAPMVYGPGGLEKIPVMLIFNPFTIVVPALIAAYFINKNNPQLFEKRIPLKWSMALIVACIVVVLLVLIFIKDMPSCNTHFGTGKLFGVDNSFCLYNLAINSKNPSYCEKASSIDRRLDCLEKVIQKDHKLVEGYCESLSELEKSKCVNALNNFYLGRMFASPQFEAAIEGTKNCTDSDQGYNWYVRGTITGSSVGTATDDCVLIGGTSILRERYCPKQLGLVVEEYIFSYKCPNGCSDGACLP